MKIYVIVEDFDNNGDDGIGENSEDRYISVFRDKKEAQKEIKRMITKNKEDNIIGVTYTIVNDTIRIRCTK